MIRENQEKESERSSTRGNPSESQARFDSRQRVFLNHLSQNRNKFSTKHLTDKFEKKLHFKQEISRQRGKLIQNLIFQKYFLYSSDEKARQPLLFQFFPHSFQ